MREHIASWLSNMSVATFVLGLFQASEKSKLFGAYASYVALALSLVAFVGSLIVLQKKRG